MKTHKETELQQAKKERDTVIAKAKKEFKITRSLLKSNSSASVGLFSKITQFTENLVLRLDDSVAKRSNDIRLKRENPRGYEADQVVALVEKNINDLDKKLANKKELTIRDMVVLNKMIIALNRVQDESASGKRYNDVEMILDKAMSIAQYQLEKTLPGVTDSMALAMSRG